MMLTWCYRESEVRLVVAGSHPFPVETNPNRHMAGRANTLWIHLWVFDNDDLSFVSSRTSWCGLALLITNLEFNIVLSTSIRQHRRPSPGSVCKCDCKHEDSHFCAHLVSPF